VGDDAGHAFLQALPPQQRTEVEAGMRRTRFPAGAVILQEGELSTDFFIVLDGMVEILRGGEPVATIVAGDVFGEAGAVDAGPGYALARNATVHAKTDTDLGIIDEAQFARLFAESEEFRQAIHERLGARSR
jgi:CRP-like cAMP-binding protein